MIERVLHWACRIFLAAIFVYAGYTKLVNELQFAASISAYQLLPPSAIMWVVKLLPGFEVILGIIILLGIKLRYTASIAGLLLAFFIAVMLVTYLRGIEADCGCFGVGEKISPLTLVRDTLMVLPALFLAGQPWLRSRGWLSHPAR
jgi:uncharacterized membrane protein YphA (DoxX/SURF4 family)